MALQAVESEEQTQRLLQALRKDMPDSVQLVNAVQTALNWKRMAPSDPGVKFLPRYAIYGCMGDEGDATVVIYTKVTTYMAEVLVHSTERTGAALRRVLAASAAVFPWDEEFIFRAVHERCVPPILEAIRDRGAPEPTLISVNRMFLAKEEALRLRVGAPPPGYSLLPCQTQQANALLPRWHFGRDRPGGLDVVASVLALNPGRCWGVFREDDTKANPVSSTLGDGGHIRMLYTDEGQRRKGLAALVCAAAARGIAERGLDVTLHIEPPNPASENNATKLGFKTIHKCVEILYRPHA